MCGRFTLKSNLNSIFDQLAVEALPLWAPRYNIAPTQKVLAVRERSPGNNREAALLRWGLVPSWADDLSIGSRMINARADTVAIKPSFRTAFKRRRCLIVADGFYEWKTAGKVKQPYFIRMADEQPFLLAGLWEVWKKSSEPIETCTIITTTANSLMAGLHERMPVILPPTAAEIWLDSEIEGADLLQSLLVPFDADQMVASPANPIVNSVKNDSPECLRPSPTLGF